jgi:hypothetical protein
MDKANGEAPHDVQHETVQDPIDQGGEEQGEMVATVATVAVVGIAAAVFEAALIPGLVLGAAAVALPKYVPKMGQALTPLFRSTVRSAYKLSRKTKEMVAEAQEHVHDIVAEVHAETGEVAAKATKAASAPAA